MITGQIIDGNGDSNKLKVLGEGEIGVVVHTHPPVAESRISLPFRDYFTNQNDQTSMVIIPIAGNNDEFSINASDEFDIFVKSISVKLADATAQFNEFGALSALSNGVEFIWESQEVGEITIHDGIKDNIEWFRLSNTPITTNSIIDLSGGGADAIVIQIDLAQLFGSPWGVKLTQGTTERIYFKVNDNLTGLDEFNIIAYGTKL